jgi:hypothetical protein
MNTLPEDAPQLPRPSDINARQASTTSQPRKPTAQHMPQKYKDPMFPAYMRVKFLLAIVAPISVQIIVQRIELLTAGHTILTIAIIVDSLRHITKRSTTLKNNLIVILPPKNKSVISSHLFLTDFLVQKNGFGSKGTHVVANYKLRICSAGQRCTNTRSRREVA